MLHTLRQPRWIVATVTVLILATVFVGLGVWQLDRLDQRKAENRMGESRLAEEPVALDELLDEAGDTLESARYRAVELDGRYDPEHEVLIRSQVELGQAGFHVITPFLTDSGDDVLVNRGWVPLTMDTPPVAAPPPDGDHRVDGWVELTQPRPALGREEPPGPQQVFNRVDIDRIAEQLPYDVAPVYVVAVGERGEELPIPLRPPDFASEGPHLAYALQWFGFAIVALVGFFFLVRRSAQTSVARSSTTS